MSYITTSMVQEAIKITPPPQTPYRQHLINREKPFGTLEILVDTVFRTRRMADYANPEGEGNIVPKTGYTTRSITPPYFKEKRPFGLRELLTRYPGQSLDSIPRDSVMESLADAIDEAWSAITLRREYTLSQFYETGAVTITIPDYTEVELDLSVPAENLIELTGNDRWGESTVDIMANWIDWQQQLINSSGGKSAEKAFFGTLAVKKFMEDDAIQALADNRRFDLLKVMSERQLDGTILFAEFMGIKCYMNPVTYDDSGTPTNIWPINKVLLPAAGARATSYYGAILDYDSIIGGDKLIQEKTFGKVVRNPHSGTIDVILQECPLDVPEENKSWLTITVCAAS